jgi:hypothetical protein
MKKWLPLFVLSLALAIIIIDTTLLNVSLSTLIHELRTNLQIRLHPAVGRVDHRRDRGGADDAVHCLAARGALSRP